MAVLKLIKVTLANGDIWFRITKDGRHVDGSLTNDEQKAQKEFDRMLSPLVSEEVVREEQS